jgi:hypothetical protein
MTKISVYPKGEAFKDRIIPAAVPQGQQDFFDYLEDIKKGRWQDIVLDVRTGKVDKLMAPGVTISGTFSRREAKGLIAHSGIIAIDLDEQDNSDINIDELCSDPFLVACHRSIRGKGFVAYFKIEPEKHLEAFQSIEKRLADKYALIADPSGKDISRYRFVSYDPDIFIAKGDIPVFKSYLPKAKEAQKRQYVHTDGDLTYILEQIQNKGINLTDSYHDWVNIAFALASKYGEEGATYFHIISAQSDKYDYDKCQNKYNQICKSKRGVKTIASFFYLCKLAGIDIQSPRTKHIERAAKINRKKIGQNGGYKNDADAKVATERLLKEIDGLEGDDVHDVINQVFTLSESEMQEDKGKSDLDDVKAYLKGANLRFNAVTRNYEKEGLAITDRDINSIYLGALEMFGKKNVNKALIENLIDSDFIPEYNPFLEFFEKNKNETPQGYVKQLIECIEFKQLVTLNDIEHHVPDYLNLFLEKWLLSVISSMHGTYSLMILVLCGKQSIGKTNFFRWLLPPELANYYGETKLDGGKDDEMLMCKKAILCDDEFGGKSKQEAKKLKELSSKQYFSIRKPYGKVHEDLMRIAVLCGTTNDEEIINDPTGNRRIIPVNVLSIDWEKYKLIDKRLLWMELYHLWQSVGDGWMLTDSDIEVLNSATTSNQQPSVEKEAILEFFEMPGNGSLDSWWTNTKIKDFIETRSRMQISSYKLGANLKSMGFVKKNIKIGGISTACYNIAVKSNHRTSFDNQ